MHLLEALPRLPPAPHIQKRKKPQILDESDISVVQIVRQELRTIIGVTERPVFAMISRWP